MKAANIHSKTADIESTLNRWLEENEEEMAEIIQIANVNSCYEGKDFGIADSLEQRHYYLSSQATSSLCLVITSGEYRS
jgi:hypothetical protein